MENRYDAVTDDTELKSILDALSESWNKDLTPYLKILEDNLVTTVKDIRTASLEAWANWHLPSKLSDELKKLVIPSRLVAFVLNPQDPDLIEVIKNAFQNNLIQKILTDLSGTKFPSPPSLRMHNQERSPFISQHLPLAIGSETKLDLRLLSGHLDDPEANSPVVEEVIKHFEDAKDMNYCDPVLFLSGSGVGKTKAIFDLMKQEYGVLFDFTPGNRGLDIHEMLKEVQDFVGFGVKNYESLCILEVILTLVARLVSLLLMLLKKTISSPSQWLFLQLNGLASRHYDDGLGHVRRYLKQMRLTYSDLILICTQTATFLGNRFFVMIDEANLLLDVLPNCFLSSTDRREKKGTVLPNSVTGKRPFFSLLNSELMSIPCVSVIVAGTRLDLKSADYWVSMVSKTGPGAPPSLKVVTNFPLMDFNNGKRILQRLISDTNVVDIVFKQFKKHIKDNGRFRYATSYVEEYLSLVLEIEDLERSVDNYFADLMGSAHDWSLLNMINRFVTSLSKQTAHDYMAKIVFAYITNSNLRILPQEAELMAHGFCRVVKMDNDYKYIIEESIIVEATMKYFRSVNFELSSWFSQDIFTAPNAAIAGVLMDSLFALSFMELNGRTFGSINCFKSIEKIHDKVINIPSIICLPDEKKESLICSLKSKSWILPKHLCGPDGMWLFDDVLVVVGIRTTQIPGRSVEKKEIDDNFGTTDLSNLFKRKESKFLNEKIQIFQEIAHVKFVIRIHLVLPRPPNIQKRTKLNRFLHTSNEVFYFNKPIVWGSELKGGKRYQESQTFQINCTSYILTIDTEHLKGCGLFKSKVCDYLSQVYVPNQLNVDTSPPYRIVELTTKDLSVGETKEEKTEVNANRPKKVQKQQRASSKASKTEKINSEDSKNIDLKKTSGEDSKNIDEKKTSGEDSESE